MRFYYNTDNKLITLLVISIVMSLDYVEQQLCTFISTSHDTLATIT